MDIQKADLERRFQELSESEILTRLSSGDLTALATQVARAELKARGVSELPNEVAEYAEDIDVEDLVEIARHLTPTEASILAACLISEDIPAQVTDVHLGQAHNFLSAASGGVRVLVPKSQAAAAAEVRAAIDRGDYALSEDGLP